MNVYDFDNTIYDGESFIDLFIFLFKKDPSLVKYIPDVINGLYKYTKGTIMPRKRWSSIPMSLPTIITASRISTRSSPSSGIRISTR